MSEDAFMENLPQVLGAPYVRKNRERRGCGWELSILSLEFPDSDPGDRVRQRFLFYQHNSVPRLDEMIA